MKNLLKKELKLATSPLSWFFLAASLMTLLPGYPILLGTFFVCLGLFQSFQSAREANDVLYTVLLPVKKRDFVKSKYAVACFFQLMAFALMAGFTAVRMTALSRAAVYVNNVLMSANPVYLAFALAIFAAFNALFVGGFFRTAYATGRPFVTFVIAAFILAGLGEALHHMPGLGWLNAVSGGALGPQCASLAAGAAIYALATLLSCRTSMRRFERIDL